MTFQEAKTICHITTGHSGDDVRIYEREGRDLASIANYKVSICAHGTANLDPSIEFMTLGTIPSNRYKRFLLGPVRALIFSHSNKFDLWHIHDLELVPFGIYLTMCGNKVIWDAHEDYETQLDLHGGKDWIPSPFLGVIRLLVRSLLRSIDKRASAIVTATPTISNRYRNAITVTVGNEARVSDFLTTSPNLDNQATLFTGSTEGQLFSEVVDAIASTSTWNLHFAGRNPNKHEIDRAQSILGSRFKYLGWLDRDGLVQAISAVSFGWVTYSPTAPQLDPDVSPTKLFEFAAAGLPVIASPIPANVEALRSGEFGVIASGYGAYDLAEALCSAANDPAYWQSCSSNGRLWAEREGSWEESRKRLLVLYDRVLCAPRGFNPTA